MSVAASSKSSRSYTSEASSSAAPARFSDARLFAMAADASAALRWDTLSAQLRRPSTRWRRRRTSATDSALFTREDPLSFSVLASARLRCSVQELRLVFDARTSEQFADVMRALSPRDLRAAELLHVAGARPRATSSLSTSSASGASSAGDEPRLAVTSLTLESTGVFARREVWCFLEHIEESDAQSKHGRWFTKTLLALPPAEYLGGIKNAKSGHDVLAGLRFEEELEGRSARALFSGELFYAGADASDSKNGASHRQVRARLLKMAEWVDRVAVVVRRRRLGIQVLADRQLGRATNTTCACCRRSFLLARRKSCALCGFNVCERCSSMEQRETCPDTFARSVISSVRVCDLCMARVDQCRYTKVAPRDLAPARVVADGINAARTRAATTGGVLTQLLQETMAGASDARKKSVLSVIKYLVEQDDTHDNQSGAFASNSNHHQARVSRAAVTLTNASTEAQHFAALQARLSDKPLPLEKCVLANAATRHYPLAYPPDAPESPVSFPAPASEQRRVQLVREEQYVEGVSVADDDERSGAKTLAGAPLRMAAVPELDIICAIACREMACSGSLITLVDRETMHVVASTLAVFARRSFPRAQGFCAQTIMSDQPLLVLRPEADVRFAQLLPVASADGVRFYCGFPLVASDGTVVGSMCCVAHEPRTLSQSQYTVMTRLARTASRVVQQLQHLISQHPTAPPQVLLMSDQKLVKNARLASSSIDWSAMRDASASWSVKKRTGPVFGGGEFTVAVHRQEGVHHIMATGSLTCSVAEMAHILFTTRNKRYLEAMSELHGTTFLSGAVVHKIDSLAAMSSEEDASFDNSSSRCRDFDVSVKTATFAKAHVFARDEQWCYVDLFEMKPDRSRFLLTMQSLRPEDVLPEASAPARSAGSARGERGVNAKNQLHEVTAGYSVVADPRGDFIWVAFYARFIDLTSSSSSSSSSPSSSGQRASRSAIKARLMKMASAMCNLPAIVQRRRLGAQVSANPKALVKPPNNSHCKCCTVALTLLVQKKRCHLCSYRVCVKCSTKQQIERAHRRHSQAVRICTKCTQHVNAANYDDLPSGLVSPLEVKPDASHDDDAALAEPPSKSLADFLRQSFERAADDVPRKRALMQVAKSLLEDEHASGRSRSELAASLCHEEPVEINTSNNQVSDSKLRLSELEFLNEVERKLVIKPTALEDCQVAHSKDTRSYSLDFVDANEDGDEGEDSGARVAKFPVPDDELARADFVQRLADLSSVPELEIICTIASQELQCATGLVTLIVGDSTHIVASSARDFQGLVVTREDSICAHTPMSSKPLLVKHPATDIRFSHIPAVHNGSVRFYCGFPLLTHDNVIFGALCCVDDKANDLTQSKYTIMAKLAGIAARILEMHCVSWATATV